MVKFLRNIKTLIIEIIGLVGGYLWAVSTNWDYEPLILILISIVGILSFIILISRNKYFRPFIDIELIRGSSLQFAPKFVRASPKKNGIYSEIEADGIYYFEFKIKYELIIRNNSNFVAYYSRIFINTNKLKFIGTDNSLVPIDLNTPKILKFEVQLHEEMTLTDSKKVLLKSNPPDVIRNLTIIVSYQNDERETYFTQYSFLAGNKYHQKLKIPLDYYELSKNTNNPL